MAKKFVVAMMMHETNTFSPLPTPIESFARAGDLSGPLAIREAEGTNTSLGGFIEVARKAGAEFTVPMAASAHPSGLVTKAAYAQMTAAIVDEVKKGCDAVLLALHGAMVADGCDDCEGDLLGRVREIAGPDAVIGATLDPHCHMSAEMVAAADLLICWKHYPHTDALDRALELVDACVSARQGEITLKPVFVDARVIQAIHLHHVAGFEALAQRLAQRQLPGLHIDLLAEVARPRSEDDTAARPKRGLVRACARPARALLPPRFLVRAGNFADRLRASRAHA